MVQSPMSHLTENGRNDHEDEKGLNFSTPNNKAERFSTTEPTPPPSEAFRSLPLPAPNISTQSKDILHPPLKVDESTMDEPSTRIQFPRPPTNDEISSEVPSVLQVEHLDITQDPLPRFISDSNNTTPLADFSGNDPFKSSNTTSETIVDTESSNETSDQSKSSIIEETFQLQVSEENAEERNVNLKSDEKQSEAEFNSAEMDPEIVSTGSILGQNNYLIPRRYSDASHNSGKIMEVDLNGNPGSRSPSVLSSQEDYSSKDSEEIEKDMLRMKHLGFLLEKHQRRLIGEDGEVWASDKGSLNESSANSNTTNGDKESQSNKMIEESDVNKSMHTEGSISTSASFKTKKGSSSSLFENYDKTWSSIHQSNGRSIVNDKESWNTFSKERLCFATVVHMLLKKYKEETNTRSSWGTISVDVVKLFWKEVLLFDAKGKDDETANDASLERILHTLTERLRYFTVIVTEKGHKTLSLSHEVYAQYARYVLECDNVSQQQIDKWNVAFSGVLQNDVISCQKGDSMQVRSDVEMYAIATLPTMIVNSMTPILDDAIQETASRDEFVKGCLSSLVVLLQNQRFLQARMEVLGGTGEENPFESKCDVVQATSTHVKDLETIASAISKRVEFVMVGEDAYDVTRAVVTMYTAWRDTCYTAMKKCRASAQDKSPIHGEFNLNEPAPHSSYRRFKKSTVTSMLMPYSQACLTWKPIQLLPATGEYELVSASSDIRMLPNGKSRGRRPGNRGLGKPAEEDRPTMPLSDVLKIDVATLSYEATVAKALYLLGESLASITSSKSLCFNRPMGRKLGLLLTGPLGCTSKLSYCASALEMYLRIANVVGFLLSDELREVDEDDLVDLGFNYEDIDGLDPSTRMKVLIKDRENASELMRQLDVLIAEGFFALGNHVLCGIQLGQADIVDMAGISLLNNLAVPSFASSATHEDKEKPSDKTKILQCYQLSMQFLHLSLPRNPDAEEKTHLGLENPDENYESELDMVKIHQRILHTAVLHAIGIHYYEQVGNFDVAKRYLDDCINKRQLLLRQLREEEGDSGNLSSSSTGSVSKSVSMKARRRRSVNYIDGSFNLSESSVTSTRRGRRSSNRRSGKARNKGKRDARGLWTEESNTGHLLLGSGKTHKECVTSIELDLSSTMEFSALATHGLSDSESALALFQEALILRALHSGKNSLDVADLQYNMGVIHDDLGQYEASLGRYGESLRVRHSQLEQLKFECSNTTICSGITDEIEDVEASVVLTLRCMTNVYHVLKDFHNAISTNLKAIELLKSQLKRKGSIINVGLYSQQGSVLGFGKMKGDTSAVPLPKLIFDEYRSSLNQNLLPKPLKQPDGPSRDFETYEGDAARNEISSMYAHIVNLLDEIKLQEGNSGNTSSGYNSSTPSSARSFLADHHSMANLVGTRHINKEHVQIDSAFNLGLIAMYFGEHKKAIDFIEQALRTLWTSFPSDSSGSDSDGSSSNKSADSSAEMRFKTRKIYVEGQAEEGILYHALAICHTALLDDERAIRCYITALRYYRKRFGMLSMIVSGALYDCATSYWNLCDFGRAEDFWTECLRILLSQERGDEKVFANILEIGIGRTLYNIAAAKVCKGEYFNEYTTTCLHDSLSIFKKKGDNYGYFSEEVAHAYFNLGLVHYNRFRHRTGKCLPEMDEDQKHSSESYSIVYGADNNKTDELKLAMACIDDSLNAYLSSVDSTEIISQAEIGQKLQHPMQAHVALVTGLINDASGSITQATWNYKTAIRLLNKVYSPQNLYTASTLDTLGDLLIGIGATEDALKSYEECLSIRARILGRKDASLSDSLFKISGILVNSSKYDKALTMQRECLEIRLDLEGPDGDGVASVLFHIGHLYSRTGELRKSQEYLEGALKVRKSRIASMTYDNHTTEEDPSVKKTSDHDGSDNTFESETNMQSLKVRSEEAELASILHHIGNIHLKIDDAATAMNYYEEAMKHWKKLCEFGEGGFSEFVQREHSDETIQLYRERLRDMADTLHNMGGAYETKSDYSRALNCYNQALVIKRHLLVETKKSMTTHSKKSAAVDDYILSSNTLSSAITLLRIGAIHSVLQNYDVALSYYKSALRIQRQHLGRDHIAVAQTLYEIGVTLRQMMTYAPDMRALDIMNMEKAAVKYFKDSLKIAKHRFGSNHEVVASVMYDIGSIHDCKGDYQEAILYYKHSTRVYGRVYGRTLCRELFDTSLRDTKFKLNLEDSHGLFHPTGQDGFITNSFLDSQPISLENQPRAQKHVTLNEKGRDAYLKASLALANAAAQSGIIGPTNTIEITFFKIIHYIVIYGVDPARASFKKIIESIFGSSSYDTTLRQGSRP